MAAGCHHLEWRPSSWKHHSCIVQILHALLCVEQVEASLRSCQMSHLPLLAFLPGAVVWTDWCRLLEEASLTCGKWHLELRVALDSALPAEE